MKVVQRIKSGKVKSTSFSKLLLMILPFIIVLSSCRKDTLDSSIAPLPKYTSLNDFFTQNAEQSETFTYNALSWDTIIGKKGIRIYMPPNNLTDGFGTIALGNVTVELKEIYTMKDMIMSHIVTSSYGSLLQSGGMFYLTFTDSSKKYHCMPNSYTQVIIPNASLIPGMSLFLGDTDTTGNMNWTLANDSSFFVSDSSNGGYRGYINSLGYGWLNCDKFVDTTGGTAKITITPQVTGDRGETVNLEAFLLFPDLNSLMSIYKTNGNQSITTGLLPLNTRITPVCIGMGSISKKMYFGKASAAITPGLNMNVQMLEVTEQQLKDSLNHL